MQKNKYSTNKRVAVHHREEYHRIDGRKRKEKKNRRGSAIALRCFSRRGRVSLFFYSECHNNLTWGGQRIEPVPYIVTTVTFLRC